MSVSFLGKFSPEHPAEEAKLPAFAVVSLENIKSALRSGIVRSVRHDPVMIDEILEVLPLSPGSTVVDGTLGLGGHSIRFLERSRRGGMLVGLDWEEQMLVVAKRRTAAPDDAELSWLHKN